LIVLDTHVLVWAIQNDPRLGRRARALIDDATSQPFLIPAMCLWEVSMLAHRGRIELGRDMLPWMHDVLGLPGMTLVPIDPEIAADSNRLPDWTHRDPVDRLIVATARRHAATLLTADGEILNYAARGHVTVIDARK
jgi:PIN domain nuclease of toxin-antitoxin system